MIGRVCRTRNEAHRSQLTRTAVVRTIGVDPPTVYGVISIRSGHENRWVTFDEPWKPSAFGPHVADFNQVPLSQLPLHAQVPVLNVRRTQVVLNRQMSYRFWKIAWRKRIGVSLEWISKCGKTWNSKSRQEDALHLAGLQIGWSADRCLQDSTLTIRNRLKVDPI